MSENGKKIHPAYQDLIRKINEKAAGKSGFVLEFLSPTMREEASAVVLNLAEAYAQEGKRVIVVDGDLYNGSMHEYFGISPRRAGLSEVLEDKEDLRNAIVSMSRGYVFLPCGRIPEKPSVMAGSARMVELLRELQEKYDVVLINGTPLQVSGGQEVIGRYVDGVVLVLSYGETRQVSAKMALATLHRLNMPVRGIVLDKYTEK